MIKGKFIDNLPKVYGIYTGGILVFIIIMAIAEQAGMTAKMIGIFFMSKGTVLGQVWMDLFFYRNSRNVIGFSLSCL